MKTKQPIQQDIIIEAKDVQKLFGKFALGFLAIGTVWLLGTGLQYVVTPGPGTIKQITVKPVTEQQIWQVISYGR